MILFSKQVKKCSAWHYLWKFKKKTGKYVEKFWNSQITVINHKNQKNDDKNFHSVIPLLKCQMGSTFHSVLHGLVLFVSAHHRPHDISIYLGWNFHTCNLKCKKNDVFIAYIANAYPVDAPKSNRCLLVSAHSLTCRILSYNNHIWSWFYIIYSLNVSILIHHFVISQYCFRP